MSTMNSGRDPPAGHAEGFSTTRARVNDTRAPRQLVAAHASVAVSPQMSTRAIPDKGLDSLIVPEFGLSRFVRHRYSPRAGRHRATSGKGRA